jgi:hypothetical protein
MKVATIIQKPEVMQNALAVAYVEDAVCDGKIGSP